MHSAGRLLAVIGIVMFPMAASAQGLNTARIDQALGRSGQKAGDVYRVGFPRTDLQVVVHGVAIKPGFALGSWAAFSGTDQDAIVMGDLVLLQGEVNPVMQKLRSAGFEITAVHNHLLDESPRIMYMHYMGRGAAAQLASSLREALAVSKTPLAKPAAATSGLSTQPAWVKTVEDTIGRKGGFNGGVLSFGVPRSEAVTLATAKDRLGIRGGMPMSPAEGVAESINFQEAGAGKVATTGDFVLTAEEVNPVISALEQHNVSVTALHSHMLTEQPRLFFMHFWAVGSPVPVADAIKAALSHISVK
jgi:hypothetical protein